MLISKMDKSKKSTQAVVSQQQPIATYDEKQIAVAI
jgi:hypothetical protein